MSQNNQPALTPDQQKTVLEALRVSLMYLVMLAKASGVELDSTSPAYVQAQIGVAIPNPALYVHTVKLLGDTLTSIYPDESMGELLQTAMLEVIKRGIDAVINKL